MEENGVPGKNHRPAASTLWYYLSISEYLSNCMFWHISTGPSLSWSYDSWIYMFTCATLWERIPIRRGVLGATSSDKVCQWLAAGRWFSPGERCPLYRFCEIDQSVDMCCIVDLHGSIRLVGWFMVFNAIFNLYRVQFTMSGIRTHNNGHRYWLHK
jgi:hypothetical protein